MLLSEISLASGHRRIGLILLTHKKFIIQDNKHLFTYDLPQK